MALVDSSGNTVVEYEYDPYGKILSAISGPNSNIGEVNPLTYRGYVYDTETKFYYLQSRYYDPELGRFLNADALISTGQGILGNNMFAYCGNNPVNRLDSSGMFFEILPELVDELLHKGNDIATDLGIDTAAIGAAFLCMFESSDGVYHAKSNCWQKFFGYNSLYDFFFNLGTSIETSKFEFEHNGVEYVIWVWKADYINLGAGAEAGIYYGGGPHWLVDTDLAMPMTLSLDYNGENIISHSQTTWWITGFNSNYLNVSASDLTATFTFYFSDPGLFNSFYHTWNGTSGWSFDPRTQTATYRF